MTLVGALVLISAAISLTLTVRGHLGWGFVFGLLSLIMALSLL